MANTYPPNPALQYSQQQNYYATSPNDAPTSPYAIVGNETEQNTGYPPTGSVPAGYDPQIDPGTPGPAYSPQVDTGNNAGDAPTNSLGNEYYPTARETFEEYPQQPFPEEYYGGENDDNQQSVVEPIAEAEVNQEPDEFPESQVTPEPAPVDIDGEEQDDQEQQSSEAKSSQGYAKSNTVSKTRTTTKSQHYHRRSNNYTDYYNSINRPSANRYEPFSQQPYQSPCQIGVIPMRSAAFQAPRIPLPKLCQHLLPDDDTQEDEDGVAFQFKPQTHCRTEVTFTIEPKPQPPWLTMLNCGFKPMVNCSAPPCYLSPNGNPGMDYMGGTQSVVNRAFGSEVQYCGMANFPTLQQIQGSFPGGKIIDASKKEKFKGSGSKQKEKHGSGDSESSSSGSDEDTGDEKGQNYHRYPYHPVGMPQNQAHHGYPQQGRNHHYQNHHQHQQQQRHQQQQLHQQQYQKYIASQRQHEFQKTHQGTPEQNRYESRKSHRKPAATTQERQEPRKEHHKPIPDRHESRKPQHHQKTAVQENRAPGRRRRHHHHARGQNNLPVPAVLRKSHHLTRRSTHAQLEPDGRKSVVATSRSRRSVANDRSNSNSFTGDVEGSSDMSRSSDWHA